MKNKKSLIIILLILVIGFIIFISTGNNDLNDEAFYVEGNGNLFIYIAKIIDNGCYQAYNFILGGIESFINRIIGE